MKKVLALLMAVLFVGGIFFSGSDSLFAATEEEAAEELLHGDTEDEMDDEKQELLEEYDQEGEELLEEYDQEGEDLPDPEEENYPDEKYEEDRG